jgi:hypothetical protein
LLKIYAHCIDGQADAANKRITDALDGAEPEPGPGEEGDDDNEETSFQTGLFTHGRKQSASWPMAGIDGVYDVSASRLNGQQVKKQAKAGQEGRITVSVNGLSPAACATASFLKIAASFARAAPLTCPPWSPAHSAGRTPGGSPRRSRRLTGPPARFLSLARLRVR